MSEKITESVSLYDGLEKMTIGELLEGINREDHKVAPAVKESLPQIERLAQVVYEKLSKGGRLFYIGAGTSGRLGIVDASECPPTYGVPHGVVVGLIAGGDSAIRKAVEFAEDDPHQAWKDLEEHRISTADVVIGIAASGTTPYVVGGLRACVQHGVATGCITCDPNAPVLEYSDFPVVVVVGPEFVTGSTRMKSGTAQKMVLNMITTSVMVKLGHVKGNRMVDMQLSNDKLVDRGTRMVMAETGLNYSTAKNLLLKHGSVRKAVENYRKGPN
ncbi:MAG: N-acetylmuramic acid 6-phosphate etherase [Salibacteraceae bacterium]